MAARPRRPATRQRTRERRTPTGEPLLRGTPPCACRAGRCASPRRLRRERAGGLALRVPVFASPSAESADLGLVLPHCGFGSLLAHWWRESVRAALVASAGVWMRRHAVFSHVCRSRGRHSAAARPEKIPKNRPACALQLCTVWRGRPVACAGRACVHVFWWPWKCPFRARIESLHVH